MPIHVGQRISRCPDNQPQKTQEYPLVPRDVMPATRRPGLAALQLLHMPHIQMQGEEPRE
jgi:hypothetical protein